MEKYHDNLLVSSAPHMVSPVDTRKIMGTVLIALIPAFAVGIYQFGFGAVRVTAVCVISCVVLEWLMNKVMKKDQTIGDLSAVLTGVLLAFNMPSGLPTLICIAGSVCAIVVVKGLFGGLGQNIVNPAVTGRVFLFIAFATEMTTWPTARGQHLDAVTAATPLGELSHGSFADVTTSNLDLFLGNVNGCIGEVSALALIIGGAFLIWKKVITWHIPVCFIATVFVLGLIWGAASGAGALNGAILQICAGGVMLGAFCCATDYVTSPTLPLGKVIFGIGCGLFTMLIRIFASYPEGVSFAILLMNILVPFIDRFVEGRMYKAPKKAEGGDK